MLLTMQAEVEAMRGVMYYNAQAIDFARYHPDTDERQRWQEIADLFTPLSKALGDRPWLRRHLTQHPGARRHGLHRGDRRGPALP